MKNYFALTVLIAVTLLPARADNHGPLAGDQEAQDFPVLVPEAAGWSPKEHGERFHTRLRVLDVPNTVSKASTARYNTPATMRALYKLPASGGSNAIAIVDAYHFPTALDDFNSFSSQFGLPRETSNNPLSGGNSVFQVVYASGVKPLSGGNYIASWNLEEALDIEWAHAMAPNAKIYLVEAANDSSSALYQAVLVASSLPGVKEVSMSWGGNEVSYEVSTYDPVFTTPGIVYFASGGDQSAQMEYPAASPNVVSCGGTSVNRNAFGAMRSETGWSDTGCGPSRYEPRPAFQDGVAQVVGNKRGVSDMAFVADPNTGVYVYTSTPVWGSTGWFILGGTSVSSPALAGIVNVAATAGNGFAANTAAEQARIYGHIGVTTAFRDIVSGNDARYRAARGYDFITGVGVPNGLVGK